MSIYALLYQLRPQLVIFRLLTITTDFLEIDSPHSFTFKNICSTFGVTTFNFVGNPPCVLLKTPLCINFIILIEHTSNLVLPRQTQPYLLFSPFLVTIIKMPTKLNLLFKKHHSHGFTLIEVLIVLAIIAILGLLLITSITKQRMRAVDARMKSDLERLSIAFEEYYNDNNCYPPLDWYNDSSDCNSENLKPYLNVLPCNPNTGQPYPLEYPVDQCSSFKLYTTIMDTSDPSLAKFCASGGSNRGNYGVSSTNVTVTTDCSGLPTPSPSSSTTPFPSPVPGKYGCQSNTSCADYGSPENAAAQCPVTFADRDECNDLCPIYYLQWACR